MGLLDIFSKENDAQISEENMKWNKMWDMWAEEKTDSPYSELMTYHSEVNNGGHAQYFDNVQSVSDLEEEISALKQILPAELKDNLVKGYNAFLVLEENEDDEAEEILDQCDDVFYENEQDIMHILEEYASKIEL